MSAPVCPTQLELTYLIQLYQSIEDNEDAACTVNCLRYLEIFLSNRRGYQRKMQIKRAVLLKYAKEQGFMQEIDDAVKAMHGNVMEAVSPDEVDDVD